MTGFGDDLQNRCTLDLYPKVLPSQKAIYSCKALYLLALQDLEDFIVR